MHFLLGDVEFHIDIDSLLLAQGETQELDVVYSPNASDARQDTLWILNNDMRSETKRVILKTTESSRRIGSTRVALSREDTISFPAPGDVISVQLALQPRGNVISGTEVFISFDSATFRQLRPESPSVPSGQGEEVLLLTNRLSGDPPGSPLDNPLCGSESASNSHRRYLGAI